MHNAPVQNSLTLQFSSLFHLYELWNIKHKLAYHTVPVSCIVTYAPWHSGAAGKASST